MMIFDNKRIGVKDSIHHPVHHQFDFIKDGFANLFLFIHMVNI